MKGFIISVILVSLVLSLTTCSLSEPQAEFAITSWEQVYYASGGDWGFVYVYYDITNTGSVTIDYYHVWFDATCVDNSVYSDRTIGSDVAPGKTHSDWTSINTANKQAINVTISDYDLETF